MSLVAAKSIDLDLGDVHISELRLQSSIDALLKTGFLSQDNDTLSFTLPIIAQWLAAEAIRRKLRDINLILFDSSQLDRWFYPLSILFRQMTYQESTEYFTSIVLSHSGIASRIIRDGVCFEHAQSLPSSNECAKMMQSCMRTWIKGLGNLSSYIAPINGEKLLPLTVRVADGIIKYSWLNIITDEDILPYSDELFVRIRGLWHSRGVPVQSTWPWIITFDYLSEKLKKLINNKAFVLNDSQIQEEAFWLTALHLSNIGELYEKNLDISTFEKFREYVGKEAIINRKHIDIEGFFYVLDKKIQAGCKEISPPFPVGDLDNYHGGMVWSNYSQKGCLEKTRFIYATALSEYLSLSNSVFKSLTEKFCIYQLAPCKLVGGLEYGGEEDTDGPRMSWYLEALPKEYHSTVDIEYNDLTANETTLFEEIRNNHLRYRPNLSCFRHVIIYGERVKMWGATPVTDVVFNWLKSDLKSIGWIE